MNITALREAFKNLGERTRIKKVDHRIAGLFYTLHVSGKVSVKFRYQVMNVEETKLLVENNSLHIDLIKPKDLDRVRETGAKYESLAKSGKNPHKHFARVVEGRNTLSFFVWGKDQPGSHILSGIGSQKRVANPRFKGGTYWPALHYGRKSHEKKSESTIRRDIRCAAWLVEHLGDYEMGDPEMLVAFDTLVRSCEDNNAYKATLDKATGILLDMHKSAKRYGLITYEQYARFEDTQYNPASSTRGRELSRVELVAIWRQLRDMRDGKGFYAKVRYNKRLALFFMLKALLGSRSMELLDLKKSELDTDNWQIVIGGYRVKTRKPLTFNLTEKMMGLVMASPAWQETDNETVFGRITEKFPAGGPCTSYDKTWHQILDQTGLYESVR